MPSHRSNQKKSQNPPERKRGRPSGSNRIPLSLEERRARNAQYERERRNETTDAMSQLARALKCNIKMSNVDLLATALSTIQRAAERDPTDNIERLTRINNNLTSQICKLQEQLENIGVYVDDDSDDDDDDNYDTNESNLSPTSSEASSEYRNTETTESVDLDPLLNSLSDSEKEMLFAIVGQIQDGD